MTKMSTANKTQMKANNATHAQPGTSRSTKLAFEDSARREKLIMPD
jgi:hypothetical protein